MVTAIVIEVNSVKATSTSEQSDGRCSRYQSEQRETDSGLSAVHCQLSGVAQVGCTALRTHLNKTNIQSIVNLIILQNYVVVSQGRLCQK